MPKLHQQVSGEMEQFYDSYFNAFTHLFGEIEERHDAALQLARGEDIWGESYHSRKVLVAQWGSDLEYLREQAFSMYALGFIAVTHCNEPFAIIQKGSLEDLFSEEPTEDEITMDYGIIADDGIEHGLWVPRRSRSESGEPTELIFASQIYLRDSQRINLDVIGEPEVTVNKAEPTAHKVYVGRSPLTDLETYHAGVQVHEFDVLWGTAARDALTRMYEKAEINAGASALDY